MKTIKSIKKGGLPPFLYGYHNLYLQKQDNKMVYKFKIYCDGQFLGFVFINDTPRGLPEYKIGTIWPFTRQGTWELNDLELIVGAMITDIFPQVKTEQEIYHDLIARAGINRDRCIRLCHTKSEALYVINHNLNPIKDCCFYSIYENRDLTKS